MYIRRRVGRRRGFFRKHRVLVLFLLAAAACLGAILVTRQLRTPSDPVLNPRTSRPALEPITQFRPTKNTRYVYPYSIIPGGVQSREELASVVGSDKVVAEHYARFAVNRAKIIRAEETKFVHVAYRLRNKVYWTKKQVRIPKGETLITDGTDFARTRCGNRVSAVPLEPVSEEEPVVETFESPALAAAELPELEAPAANLEFNNVPDIQPWIPVHRPTILPYYYHPIFVARANEVVVRANEVLVPEPATLTLLSIGLAALFTVRHIRKK